MEIGGYLEFERYSGPEYHSGCLKLNTARNCLKYLIEARKIKKLWISRWNCSAVLDTCINSGIEIAYYELNSNFRPILPKDYNPKDYVYVVNYYGQISDIRYEHIILDNVQAFFEKPVSGMDTIYTCRKFFGVTDGAYLYTDCRIERELEQDKSFPRIEYLAGRLEENASPFYSLYQENEERLDKLPLMRMSPFTENLLRSLDYARIQHRREKNYDYLYEMLGKHNLLSLIKPVGPFAYPFMCEKGEDLRKILQTEKIYIAKLWPNVKLGKEGLLASNILPIPCDQRYDENDLAIICRIIEKFLKGNSK